MVFILFFSLLRSHFLSLFLTHRLVTVTGTRDNISKAFAAIGKKIEQVSKLWLKMF